MHQYTGHLLAAIGGVHLAAGVRTFRLQLQAIARDGVVDAVLPYGDRQTAVWFLLTGGVVMMWGQSIAWTQRQTGMVPPALPWHLLAGWFCGVLLMPRSGFWLLLPVALLARGSRSARASTDVLRSS